jgi:hypothetical protein
MTPHVPDGCFISLRHDFGDYVIHRFADGIRTPQHLVEGDNEDALLVAKYFDEA